jgi:hypothetical protein
VAPLASESNTPTCEIMGFGANSAWRERGGGVEDSDVELRPDDNALRSAFLGDFRIALKEDMMIGVQKARGEVKDCATISHEQNICLCSNGPRQCLFTFHYTQLCSSNNRRLAQRSPHENGIRCEYHHSIYLISQVLNSTTRSFAPGVYMGAPSKTVKPAREKTSTGKGEH